MKKLIFFIFYKFILFLNFLSSNKLIYNIISNFQENSYIKKRINKNNLKFFVPNSISRWRVDTFFTQEPETLKWIDSFIIDNDNIIFWDIGANIGLYSIYAGSKYENIEIVSFEPSTSNLRILSRNIFLNKFEEKIKISQFPLSDKSNCYELMSETEFKEGYSMSTYAYNQDFEGNLIKTKHRYRIFGTTINFLIENNILEAPNYVKIDVDGIEHRILKSATQILKNKKLKGLLIEINENYKEQFEEVLEIMFKFGFKIKFKKQSKFVINTKFNKTFNYVFERTDEL